MPRASESWIGGVPVMRILSKRQPWDCDLVYQVNSVWSLEYHNASSAVPR